MQWSEKYRPKRFEDVVGQEKIIKEICKFIEDWKSGNSLLLHGPTGIGKNVVVSALANEKDMILVEINPNEMQTDSIKKILPAVTQDSLFSRKKLILIDEIDCLIEENNNVSEIIKIIEKSKFPLILTANDPYTPKLKQIREKCMLIHMKKINPFFIEKKLKEICKKECVNISEKVIKNIVKNSDGDLRSAINDLQILCHGKKYVTEMDVIGLRERRKNIFDVLRNIFRNKNLKIVLNFIEQCEKDSEDVFWWVEQNIPIEFENPVEMAEAFDILSRADIFRSKMIINKRFKKYMQNMIAGLSLIRKRPILEFKSYKPPNRLITLGLTKSIRQKQNKLFENLGKFLHCSKRSVKNQLPYLKIILGDNLNLVLELGFTKHV